MGVNASALGYRLISSQFAAADANGRSLVVGLEGSYPLLRSRTANLYVGANLDDRTFTNRAVGVVTSNYGVDALTLNLRGNLFDNWGGGGANAASLSLISSRLDLAGSPSQAGDALTTRAAGQAQILRYSLSRQQALPGLFGDRFSLFAAWSGQWANKNLDSSDKFYLGGANGVRAYPSNEGSGARGDLLNLELRAKLPLNSVLTTFFDWGHVVGNVSNNYTGAPTVNAYSLKGAGLSLASTLPSIGHTTGTLRLTWARRVGSNPNPYDVLDPVTHTVIGVTDQDGSLDLNRFWLSASFSL